MHLRRSATEKVITYFITTTALLLRELPDYPARDAEHPNPVTPARNQWTVPLVSLDALNVEVLRWDKTVVGSNLRGGVVADTAQSEVPGGIQAFARPRKQCFQVNYEVSQCWPAGQI